MDVIFDGNVALYGGHVLGHHIRRVQSRERIFYRHLRVALARRAQQEPSDERGPQSADWITIERLPHAHENHQVAEKSSGIRRDLGGAREVAGDSPGDSAQDPTAIERKSRNQIENRTHYVDLPEPGTRGNDKFVAMHVVRYQPA